jgi:hypothetical protein
MPQNHQKKGRFDKVIKTVKKAFVWGKENFSKKGVQVGISILIVVMLMLGLNIDWRCGSQGWNCDCGYTPPNPDDVNKIIKPADKKPK